MSSENENDGNKGDSHANGDATRHKRSGVRPAANQSVENQQSDELDREISAFYDDLANEPLPDRLKKLLKTLNEKDPEE